MSGKTLQQSTYNSILITIDGYYTHCLFFLGSTFISFFGSSEQVVHGNGMLSAETIIPIQIPVEASIKEK